VSRPHARSKTARCSSAARAQALGAPRSACGCPGLAR
jgi:hypothetical protein